ncbi:MAG: 1,4-dihydroxy-2-naphthoate octaprenyltransferase [halophilic archaeon J07HX5]|nr:MAG: 1,4-dihydroxy-2-naphthoate octaprenyltransferase [halophilic archaeon J07HX5]
MLSALLNAVPVSRGAIQPYLALIRVQFLSFTVVVVSLPAAVAVEAGVFSPANTVFALGSVLFAHIAVNTLNLASDYRTGIDAETDETPYSGGNDVITNNTLSYRRALFVGTLSIVLSASFVLPLVLSFGAPVLLFYGVGITLVVGYTDVFARVGLGETACGLGLTLLPTIAVGYIQAGRVLEPLPFLGVPMFLIGFNLLLLNELPDVAADSSNGRVNIPIVLGRQRAGELYFVLVAALVGSLLYLVWTNDLPVTVLVALLPVVLLASVFDSIVLQRDPELTEAELAKHILWTQATIAGLTAGMLLTAL